MAAGQSIADVRLQSVSGGPGTAVSLSLRLKYGARLWVLEKNSPTTAVELSVTPTPLPGAFSQGAQPVPSALWSSVISYTPFKFMQRMSLGSLTLQPYQCPYLENTEKAPLPGSLSCWE